MGLYGDKYEDIIYTISKNKLLDNYQKSLENYYLKNGKNDMRKVSIPKGHYFVIGDNLNNSHDSRMHGLIKESKIVGKVIFYILCS